MKVPYIKASFQEAAYNLENKIKTIPQTNKENYIIDRLFAANEKIRDTFTGEKASKIFKRVEDKASKDWASMHKIQNFLLKNAGKISKAAVFGAVAATGAAAVSLLSKITGSAKSND